MLKSLTKGMLKMVMGKTSLYYMLKKSFNRAPTNTELIGYFIPTELENSKDCLVDMLSSMKNDDLVNAEKYLEILSNLLSHTNVVQIVANLDVVHSMDEALKLKEILSNYNGNSGKSFKFKSFENASHCLIETESEDFNKYISLL